MTKRLSESQVDAFRERGYLCPLSALSADELAAARENFSAFETREGGRIEGHKRNKPHLFLKWLYDLARHPAILDAVEDLIGPNILLYHAQWFIKEPRTEDYVSFHQDSAYWGLAEANALSVWLAFEDADADNGCMQVVPGSHKLLLDHVERRHENNMLWRGQTVDGGVELGAAVDLALRAGEMSIHHARIVHGSGANRSDRRRVGYSMRYVPTHVERIGPRDSALLVRGVDEFGHFDLESAPEADYDPAGLRLHAEVTEVYMENYQSAPTERERLAGAPASVR